jgi:hypothetical protein
MKEKKYILFAVNVLNENAFVDINDPALSDQNLMTSRPQEWLLQRKESYEELSEEAKEVAELILTVPTELLSYMVTKKYKSFSLRRLRKFLRKRNGWSRKKTKQVLSELKKYTKEISYRI